MVELLDARVATAPRSLRLVPAAERVSPPAGGSPEADSRQSLLHGSPRELARAVKRAIASAHSPPQGGTAVPPAGFAADGLRSGGLDSPPALHLALGGGDVWVPAELLAPLPQLELTARDVLASCHDLSALVNEANPLDRFLIVVAWCLSSLRAHGHGQLALQSGAGERVEIQDDQFFVVHEQLSDAPSVTSFRAMSLNEKLSVHGQIETHIRSSAGGLEVLTVGSKTIDLAVLGETYLISGPESVVSWSGPSFLQQGQELSGVATIRCPQSGYVASLQMKPRSLLWKGARNKVTGKIKSNKTSDGKKGEETRFTVSGHWDGIVVLEEKRNGIKTVLFDSQNEGISPRSELVRGQRRSSMEAPDAAQQAW